MKSDFVRNAVAPLLLGCMLGACYDQVPLTTVPSPATRIIATVTDTGTVVMANTIGPGAQEVEGVVSAADPEAWKVNLMRVDHRGGSSVLWNRELVTFPRFALTKPTVTRVDKTRSWITGGLIAAGVFLAAKMFSTGGNDDNQITPPPPPVIRIPGVTWR